MNIKREEIIEQFEITETQLELFGQLCSDLWSGPFYLVDSELNAFESITVGETTYHFGDYSSQGIIGDAFPKLLELNQPLMDELKKGVYYEEETGCFMSKEPEGWFDEDHFNEDYPDGVPDDEDEDRIKDRYWSEPWPYYHLEFSDLVEILSGPVTAREVCCHF